MPITYTIDTRACLIRTVCSGDMTFAEVEEHFRELSATWPGGLKLDVLLDMSSCTSLPEISQLRDVVSMIDRLGGRQRFGACAIVATRELLYGLLRVFEVMADQRFMNLRVFRNETDALAWLCERSSAAPENI